LFFPQKTENSLLSTSAFPYLINAFAGESQAHMRYLHFGIQVSKKNLSHPFDSRGLNVNRKQIQGVKNYGCAQ